MWGCPLEKIAQVPIGALRRYLKCKVLEFERTSSSNNFRRKKSSICFFANISMDEVIRTSAHMFNLANKQSNVQFDTSRRLADASCRWSNKIPYRLSSFLYHLLSFLLTWYLELTGRPSWYKPLLWRHMFCRLLLCLLPSFTIFSNHKGGCTRSCLKAWLSPSSQ